MIYCSFAYSISLTHLYPPYLAQILGFWVTCEVKMMSLCHGWGWQPPQTASHIHIRNLQSVWAHWYAVHRHMVAALHSFPHSNKLRFWSSGSLVIAESKWCHYAMFEADSQIKLLPPSILNICKVIEHMNILSIGIWQQPWTVICPTWPRFWGSGSHVESKWCQNVMVEVGGAIEIFGHFFQYITFLLFWSVCI